MEKVISVVFKVESEGFQAITELRESKKADRKQKVEEHRAKISADFDAFKQKFKKKDKSVEEA